MARQLQPDDPHRLEPPMVISHHGLSRTHPIDFLFSKHPLYTLRKCHIAIAALGIILFSFCPMSETVTFSVVVLFVSIFICAADLLSWASRQAKQPDEEPEWPLKKYMFFDSIMAVFLQIGFWTGVDQMSWGRYYESQMGLDYAYLTVLICSLLHAYAFWKQLKISCTRSWLASLQLPIVEPCARCGYTTTLDPPVPSTTTPSHQRHHHPSLNPQHSTRAHTGTAGPAPPPPRRHHRRPQGAQSPPNLHLYAGPSAFHTPATAVSPPSSAMDSDEGRMEEGLLIGSEYGGTRDYGSTAASTVMMPQCGSPAASRRLQAECEDVLEAPADVVVGSGGRRGGKQREKDRGGK